MLVGVAEGNMKAGAAEARRSLVTLELEFQVFVVSLAWILRPELIPLENLHFLFTAWAISLGPSLFFSCIMLQLNFLFTFHDCGILSIILHAPEEVL